MKSERQGSERPTKESQADGSQTNESQTNKMWALVSGASSGIGRATALAFAQAGYNLYILGRRDDRLQSLKAEILSAYPNHEVRVGVFDITQKSQVEAFVQQEQRHLEKVDVLINNAGLARGTEKLQDGKIADWESMIDTNIKGVLYLTRAILPAMIQRRSGGHIINIGSVAGRWVYPGGGVYCATKFAIRAFSEGLRLDLQGTGIRVTNIEPGMVKTEFSKVRFGSQPDAEKLANAVYEGMTPLSAKDIAETAIWCASRPNHVNIQEVVIFPTDQAAVGPNYVNRKVQKND